MRLAGKVAVVTGFGSGLGRAIAMNFAAQGAKIAGLSRSPGAGEETLRQILGQAREALFIPTDVRDVEQVQQAIARTMEAFGRLDIVVNSAGVRITGTATEISEEGMGQSLGYQPEGDIPSQPGCYSRDAPNRWRLHHQYFSHIWTSRNG